MVLSLDKENLKNKIIAIKINYITYLRLGWTPFPGHERLALLSTLETSTSLTRSGSTPPVSGLWSRPWARNISPITRSWSSTAMIPTASVSRTRSFVTGPGPFVARPRKNVTGPGSSVPRAGSSFAWRFLFIPRSWSSVPRSIITHLSRIGSFTRLLVTRARVFVGTRRSWSSLSRSRPLSWGAIPFSAPIVSTTRTLRISAAHCKVSNSAPYPNAVK